jgi:hypothetical protein
MNEVLDFWSIFHLPKFDSFRREGEFFNSHCCLRQLLPVFL